jgi:hypothetical protein
MMNVFWEGERGACMKGGGGDGLCMDVCSTILLVNCVNCQRFAFVISDCEQTT